MDTLRSLPTCAVFFAPVLWASLFFASSVFAAEPPAPPDSLAFAASYRPSLEVSPAAGAIRVDGDLDDPGWRGAARARGFAEVDPGDQVRPPVESEAWITYDEANLYVALIARDDPKDIRVSWRERDDIFRDDYFGFMLDTYGDHAWGYEFFVNPLGIQGDLRIFSGGDEDISFDVIWDSKGKVTEEGYQVELAIPFRSLRFPPGERPAWRANFWRDHPRNIRRKYAWAATDRDEPCWMCQWGTLTGITPGGAGRNLEAIANVIGYWNGERPEEPPSRFRFQDPRGQASLNLRYTPTSTSSAEVSFNPDFSQIESDAGRIDVNEPFAIYYPEKRPFFQEGSELYNTPLTAIYTRSISDPDQAAKLAGHAGRSALAWTFAHDRNSPVILPMEEQSFQVQAKETVANVLRFRQTMGESSNLGVLFTDRRQKGGGSGTLGGLDGSFRFLGHLRFGAQGLLSFTQEPRDPSLRGFRPAGQGTRAALDTLTFDYGRHTLRFDGEKLRGHALYATLGRDGRVWNGHVDFQEFHPDFRADNGFITRTDIRMLESWNGLEFRTKSPVLLAWEPNVVVGQIWDYSGRYQDDWLIPALSTSWIYQTELNIEYVWSKERFREQLFPGIRRVEIEANTRLGERVGLAVSLNSGRTIRRVFDPDQEPFLARSRETEFEASIKPWSRLLVQPSFTHERLRSADGRALIYDLYVARNRFDLQVTREISVRLINEYDQESRMLTFEPLLTCRINPFSVFYLGMSDEYAREQDVLRVGSRQVFAKLQYLFRI